MTRFIALFLLSSLPSIAQPVIFNHRLEDREFLNYYYIWNQFDSSVTMYDFGEFAFISETARQNIPLSGFVKDRQRIQGTDAQGISTDVQELARTKDFFISGEGEIQWFGQLQSFRAPCDHLSGYDTARGEGPNRPSPDWGVVDRTEFVVQLVDTYSGTILTTLDSVGVHPTGTTSPFVDTRYGVRVERTKRSAFVPATHTGKTAYIRVSPRRYGPTPFGLILSCYDVWVNQSAKYDSTGTTYKSLSEIKALREMWFNQLLDYCDSVKGETGWLPDLEGLSFSKDSHLIAFNNRYFNSRVAANGDTAWQERHTQVLRKRAIVTEIRGDTKKAPFAVFKNVAPNPATSETAEINFIVGIDMSARLELISIDGKRVGTIWQGFLMMGRPKITVTVPRDLPNGSYLLVLEQENGERVNQTSFVVAR